MEQENGDNTASLQPTNHHQLGFRGDCGHWEEVVGGGGGGLKAQSLSRLARAAGLPARVTLGMEKCGVFLFLIYTCLIRFSGGMRRLLLLGLWASQGGLLLERGGRREHEARRVGRVGGRARMGLRRRRCGRAQLSSSAVATTTATAAVGGQCGRRNSWRLLLLLVLWLGQTARS